MATNNRRRSTPYDAGLPADSSDSQLVPYNKMQFVNIELSEVEKTRCKELMQTEQVPDGYLDDLVAAGFTITFNRDKRGGGTLCSLKMQLTTHDYAGLILTGRGRTVSTALFVAYFKDVYIAGDDGWKAAVVRRGGVDGDIG